MAQPKDHPIISVLTNGICRELNEVRKLELVRASLILLYSGLDQVSFLAMPVGQSSASRQDFASWVEKYIVLQGDTLVSGLELYAARCAMLHKYGSEAKLHVDGTVERQIDLVVGGPRKVYFQPSNPKLMLIEFNYLIDAFLDGVLKFTQELGYADAAYRDAVNDWLHSMLDEFALEDMS